jgi:hypothetical protein
LAQTELKNRNQKSWLSDAPPLQLREEPPEADQAVMASQNVMIDPAVGKANVMSNQNNLNDTDIDVGNIKRPHENLSNPNRFHMERSDALGGAPPTNSDPQLQL